MKLTTEYIAAIIIDEYISSPGIVGAGRLEIPRHDWCEIYQLDQKDLTWAIRAYALTYFEENSGNSVGRKA